MTGTEPTRKTRAPSSQQPTPRAACFIPGRGGSLRASPTGTTEGGEYSRRLYNIDGVNKMLNGEEEALAWARNPRTPPRVFQAWGSCAPHPGGGAAFRLPREVLVSLPPAIPQRGARQQNPPPLHRLLSILVPQGRCVNGGSNLTKIRLTTCQAFRDAPATSIPAESVLGRTLGAALST